MAKILKTSDDRTEAMMEGVRQQVNEFEEELRT